MSKVYIRIHVHPIFSILAIRLVWVNIIRVNIIWATQQVDVKIIQAQDSCLNPRWGPALLSRRLRTPRASQVSARRRTNAQWDSKTERARPTAAGAKTHRTAHTTLSAQPAQELRSIATLAPAHCSSSLLRDPPLPPPTRRRLLLLLPPFPPRVRLPLLCSRLRAACGSASIARTLAPSSRYLAPLQLPPHLLRVPPLALPQRTLFHWRVLFLPPLLLLLRVPPHATNTSPGLPAADTDTRREYAYPRTTHDGPYNHSSGLTVFFAFYPCVSSHSHFASSAVGLRPFKLKFQCFNIF
ncbi:hypothetical protein B0H13DRAFT_2428637 [Mycena leptocephala]|nr:hypothetical protein B0H13DRAFT_2428637 [Mycena leptocephala]